MAICEFNELDCCVGEGMIGVCVRFGAPIMHRMYGINLAWQGHASCEHVYLRSHYRIGWFGGLLLRLHALVNVKSLVFSLACSAWVMRCIALLCRAILRLFKYECSHVDNRCGHVSLSLIQHNV